MSIIICVVVRKTRSQILAKDKKNTKNVHPQIGKIKRLLDKLKC